LVFHTQRKLQVEGLENGLLRERFGAQEEVIGERRKPHKVQLHDLYC
jgi:hypothetical protein